MSLYNYAKRRGLIEPWTEARIARMKELWGQPGWTRELLAAEIGVSVPALRGKADHCGLPKWPLHNWTPENVEKLRIGWGQSGMTVASLAQECGVTYHAVINKANRLKLPKWPQETRAKYNFGTKQLKWQAAEAVEVVEVVEAAICEAVTPEPVSKVVSVYELPVVGPARTCQFPMWGNEIGAAQRSGFHYCGERSVDGKSFCLKHCRLAYVRVSAKELM